MKFKTIFFPVIVLLCVCFNSSHLSAHPHMFIDAKVKFMVNDTTLGGFYVYWDFDEMNSAMLIDKFDINKNNRLEKSEFSKIETSISSLADQNYYIFFSFGKKFLKINKIENFVATITSKARLQYAFFVPCDILLESIENIDVVAYFEDPSFFIDFDLKKDLIQASSNDKWISSIRTAKVNYTNRIFLTVKRK